VDEPVAANDEEEIVEPVTEENVINDEAVDA